MATDNKMFVKLGSMVNPQTFWATELPNDATLAPNGKHSKILKIEENLTNIISHDFSNTDRFALHHRMFHFPVQLFIMERISTKFRLTRKNSDFWNKE